MVDNNVALIMFKIFFIYLSVLMTTNSLYRIYYKSKIPAQNFVWQAIGITGVIVCFVMF